MKNFLMRYVVAFVLILSAGSVMSQGAPQTISVPLSRPGEPLTLDVSILSARIEVIGEDRQDVEIEFSIAGGERKIITPSGTKTLTGGGYVLEVDEEDNYVEIDTDWRANKVNVTARVPRRADMSLSTTNDGEIIVRDIVGNLELENVNGPITATDISGAVIAETVNERIDISFSEISDSTAMAFSSVNGDLNVDLPADAGVQLHIDTSRGEIYSDFEVEVQQTEPTVERREDRGGIEVRIESVIVANINGGGPVIKLKSLNGNISIGKSDE